MWRLTVSAGRSGLSTCGTRRSRSVYISRVLLVNLGLCRFFYWTAKCSCILGMSLKLKGVLGDSHKPTRAIPRLIYLFFCRGRVTALPQRREENTQESSLLKKLRSSFYFPAVSNKTKTVFRAVWGKVRLQCQVISTGAIWWLGLMQQQPHVFISCFFFFLWMNSRLVRVWRSERMLTGN